MGKGGSVRNGCECGIGRERKRGECEKTTWVEIKEKG